MVITEIPDLSVQNHALREEVRRRAEQLTTLNAVVAAVSQSLHLQDTLEMALASVCSAAGAEAGGISLIDEAAGEIVLRAQRGWLRDFVRERPLRVPLGTGISGQVIASGEVFVNNQLDETTQFAVPSFRDEQFQSMAMAPMRARGKVIGILSIMSLQRDAFDHLTIDLLRNVADSVGTAIDNARLYEALLENEHQLTTVLHSTADGIIATDQAARITLINAAAQEMIGVAAGQVIGLPLRDAPLPPHIRESLRFALGSSDRRRQTAGAEDSDKRATDERRPANQTFRVTTETGRVLSVLVSPIRVESQFATTATDGWVIVLQDVTHLRDAEVARTRFIKTAAHDMRNPLGAAINALELLSRTLTVPGKTALDPHEVISIAQASVGRVQALIDNLLHLEAIEAGENLALTEIDLGDLVQQISAEIYPRLQAKRLRYRVDFETAIPPLLADRGQLVRALENYMDNAIRYAPTAGEVRLRLYIVPPSTRDPDGGDPMLHIEVSDSGPGIPVEAQARLFERFYRADLTSTGTGLGLAIVKSVAENHGGRVYLHSDAGRGSVFGFAIRLAPTR